jgi:hypothetical protein
MEHACMKKKKKIEHGVHFEAQLNIDLTKNLFLMK